MAYQKKPVKNSGGAREGAGRPSKNKEFNDEFKNGILNALKRKEKLTGVSIFELFADRIYSKRTPDLAFSGMFKIVTEVMTVKESKKIVEQRHVIALPTPVPVEKADSPKIIDIPEAEVVVG